MDKEWFPTAGTTWGSPQANTAPLEKKPMGDAHLYACRLLHVLAKNDERWGEGEQQDAQEVLHSVLDYVQTDMQRTEGRTPAGLGFRRGSLGLSEALQVTLLFTYLGCDKLLLCIWYNTDVRRRGHRGLGGLICTFYLMT